MNRSQRGAPESYNVHGDATTPCQENLSMVNLFSKCNPLLCANSFVFQTALSWFQIESTLKTSVVVFLSGT